MVPWLTLQRRSEYCGWFHMEEHVTEFVEMFVEMCLNCMDLKRGRMCLVRSLGETVNGTRQGEVVYFDDLYV